MNRLIKKNEQMLLERALIAHGGGSRACERIYFLLKLWAAHCHAMDPAQSQQLETIAEQVKRAELAIARYSPSANAKTRFLALGENAFDEPKTHSARCAAEIWTDMALRAAQEPQDHISADIKNALSFLHTDPEVKLVVEAHQILQHAHALFDACLQHTTVLKHSCSGGCCSFELAFLDDFESLYTARAHRV